VNKRKDKLKEAHDKIISCDTSVSSGSSKVIIPKEPPNLFNNAKLTANTNKLRNKIEVLLFRVSHFDVYKTPASDEEKQNILEKTNLLGHFSIHAMEQVIHQGLNILYWKGLREDVTK
jgi:hypothetical protein